MPPHISADVTAALLLLRRFHDAGDGRRSRSVFSLASLNFSAINSGFRDEIYALENANVASAVMKGDSDIAPASLSVAAHIDSWSTSSTSRAPRGVEDIIVFIGLESLGTLAIVGNVCLIVVLLKNKYLNRASFILMLSLAIADVLHGIVTTSFFYPPILLKFIPVSSLGVRIFNVIDWTAWSITLTRKNHMSAICLDRLIAIMLYGRYNLIVTVKRVRSFTVFCWSAFFLLNSAYILLRFCCLIAPLRNNQYYTFGYGEFETTEEIALSPFGATNFFTLTYTPLELATIAVLSISNPITLVQLYRRHKRKLALRMASTMLLEMSMRMGSKTFSTDVRELAARRANRQQQRILLQISVVAVIFYLYMTTYYLVYHVLEVDNKWVVLFNSFFYSTTHMINPVIYFSLNKEMRAQLNQALNEFIGWMLCVNGGSKSGRHYDGFSSLRRTSFDHKTSTVNRNEFSLTATETSPLVSQQHQALPKQQHLHYSSGNYAACAVITHDYCQDAHTPISDANNNDDDDSSGSDSASPPPPSPLVVVPLSQANCVSNAVAAAVSRHASISSSPLAYARRLSHDGYTQARNSITFANAPFRTAIIIDNVEQLQSGAQNSSSMRSAIVYENTAALEYFQAARKSSFAADHSSHKTVNALTASLLKDFDIPHEHLELELVSTASVDNFTAYYNDSDKNAKNRLGTNDTKASYFDECRMYCGSQTGSRRVSSGTYARRDSCQAENSAFMNLARCLEEQARLFFEAENVAIKRAAQQRSELLDALIEALRCYKPVISLNGSSDTTDSSEKRAYKPNGVLNSGDTAMTAHCVNIAGKTYASFSNMRHRPSDVAADVTTARLRASNHESDQRADGDLRTLLETNVKLTKEAANLRRAISERSRVLEASSRPEKAVSSQCNFQSPIIDEIAKVDATSEPSFITSLASCYHFPHFKSNSELYHHLSPSSSWRQWREVTIASTANEDTKRCNDGVRTTVSPTNSFMRMSRKDMLRDSLLMLLDSSVQLDNNDDSVNNSTSSTILNVNTASEVYDVSDNADDSVATVYVCRAAELPTDASHSISELVDERVSENDESKDEDKEVVFL